MEAKEGRIGANLQEVIEVLSSNGDADSTEDEALPDVEEIFERHSRSHRSQSVWGLTILIVNSAILVHLTYEACHGHAACTIQW